MYLRDAIFVRCYLYWIPFLRGGIFDKRKALFVNLCQWVPQILGGFRHFDQAPLLDV